MGASYAVFTDTFKSDKKQVVEVGTTKIELVEPSTGLSLGSVEEMSDSDGLVGENYYSFSIRNTGDSLASYKLFLLDDADSISTYEGTLLDDNYIRVGLVKNDVEIGPINIATTNRLIDSGTLEKGEENNYKLRLWLNFEGLSDGEKDVLDGQSKFLKLKLVGSQELGNTSNLANNWKTYTENETTFKAIYTLATRKLPETYTYNEKEYTKVKEVDVSEQQNKTVFLGEYQNGSELIALMGQDGGVIAPQNCNNLFGRLNVEVLDVTKLYTPQTTNMNSMFRDTPNITKIDVSTFDTSKVTDMGWMFQSASFTEIRGLENFNTENVTRMTAMFQNTYASNLNLLSFDTSKVTNLSYMFWGCTNLSSLNLTSFDTKNTTNFNKMFESSRSLSKIEVGCNWIINEGSSVESMFSNTKVSEVTRVCN